MSDPKACPATLAAKLTIKCEQLERQRNGLARIARDYIENLDDSGDEAKAKDYRRWLNRILLENVELVRPLPASAEDELGVIF